MKRATHRVFVSPQSGARSATYRHRFSTKFYDFEIGLSYYGYRFYSTSLSRWLNRDPIEEAGGVNLYEFCQNNCLCKTDSLGKNIYLVTGNDSGRYLNDKLHQSVCVDEWARKRLYRKQQRTCFSFAYMGNFERFESKITWLEYWVSPTLPGYLMEGEIYETCFVGHVIKTKTTSCWQDMAWTDWMRKNRVGKKDVYSILRHNCRMYSQHEFADAPGTP